MLQLLIKNVTFITIVFIDNMAMSIRVIPPHIFPLELPALPETHPLIQCIIDGNLKKVKKLIRKNNSINALYPCKTWEDYITPLMAAVRSGEEEICTFLLKKDADPNKPSQFGWRPLHYASYSTVAIVRKLLEAKAYPDQTPGDNITPLQEAVKQNRPDVVKELIRAGAFPDSNYGIHPNIDVKLVSIISKFATDFEDFSIMKIFFDFSDLLLKKTPQEVFQHFSQDLFKEHPITHLTLMDFFFRNFGPQKEEYQRIGNKFLKGSGKLDSYIEETIRRFSRIPARAQWNGVNSLAVVFCIVKEISVEDSLQIIPKLLNYLSSEMRKEVVPDEHRLSCIKLLYLITQKTAGRRDGWDSTLVMSLYKGVLPFTKTLYSSRVGILTYAILANLFAFECVPPAMASSELTSVPEKVLSAAEMELDEDLKEKLRWLNTALQNRSGPALEPGSEASQKSENCSLSEKKKRRKKKKKKTKSKQSQLPTQEEGGGCRSGLEDKVRSNSDSDNEFGKSVQESGSFSEGPGKEVIASAPEPRCWFKTSARWASQLEKFASLSANEVYKLGSINLVIHERFRIAKGSDGTEVYLGLKDDGTEVAIKRMIKSNYQVLKNEREFLRLPKLDNPHIVRYVDFAEDDNFGYLVLQLCEYTVEEYIKEHLPQDRAATLKGIVYDVLQSLSVLHSDDIKILHRDIKPQNVLIDVTGKARLADFGISRRLRWEDTTLHTASVGTRCWMARETLDEDGGNAYKRSSDIQVAGMLVYYILSGGHHPFGKGAFCEANIFNGKYCLDQVDDEVAKDLIEWMIQKDPNKRAKIDETLAHPLFWEPARRVEYLKRVGNQNEAENCRGAAEELLQVLDQFTCGKSFAQWKSKVPTKQIELLESKKKVYPENTLGLLRFIRNLHEHYAVEAEELDLMGTFPDLFGSVYKFAQKMGWNSRADLKKIFHK
ncbi:serine/threonine-protein kinase ppk4-like [Arapaima gigas]